MSEFKNEAAWLETEKARAMVVGPGPSPAPLEDEVVIKVGYAAVNPTDWKMQDEPYFSMDYPFIFGTDVAGVVVQVGSKVTNFHVGQRVLGHCHSLLSRNPANAGFQRYSTCRELMVSAVPDSTPLANAAVMPLGVDTAATALYRDLKLSLPSLTPKPTGKSILIWGASSSVGSCAVQLAVASGVRVIATASKSNADYVRNLGAEEVFDYREHDVVDKILASLKQGDHVLDCIGDTEIQAACGKILSVIGGGTLPLMLVPSTEFPDNVKPQIVNGAAPGYPEDQSFGPFGFGAAFIGKAVWHEYMPAALEQGKFLPKPDPFVIKGGLAKVQEGVDMLRKGVSAKKLVIEIDADVQ